MLYESNPKYNCKSRQTNYFFVLILLMFSGNRLDSL